MAYSQLYIISATRLNPAEEAVLLVIQEVEHAANMMPTSDCVQSWCAKQTIGTERQLSVCPAVA